jgi:hypothetical protein
MNTSSTSKDSKLIAEAYSRIHLRIDEELYHEDPSILPPKVKEFLQGNKRADIREKFYGKNEKGEFVAVTVSEPYGEDDRIKEHYMMYFDAESPLYLKQSQYEALKAFSYGQERAKS